MLATKEQYSDALMNAGLTNRQRDAILAVYDSPNHTATSGMVADSLGLSTHSEANMAFGSAAHKVADYLDVIPPSQTEEDTHWWSVLATWDEELRTWTLYPELVAAIDEFGAEENSEPVANHSWVILNDNEAEKITDKSVFHHHGSGIPIGIRSFFNCSDLAKGERKDVILTWSSKSFPAHIKMDNQPNPRTQILWQSDFEAVLKGLFPEIYASLSSSEELGTVTPIMVFKRTAGDTYDVTFHASEAEKEDDTAEKEAEEEEKKIRSDTTITETEKEQLCKSRRGQSLFRKRLEDIEDMCRITGVSAKQHLIASHIKPWAKCTNKERLDGENGLLLAPHVDHLFDKGYISFEDDGNMLLSPSLSTSILEHWGINSESSVGEFTTEQQKYLSYHRQFVFKNGEDA